MKRILLSALVLAVAALTGCGPAPYEQRLWEGTLYRSADDKALSEVCLILSDDTLRIYSNAIFGSGNDTLVCQHRRAGKYTFAGHTGTDFTMEFKYGKEKGRETEELCVYGPDYRISLHPAAASDWTSDLPAFYRNREVPVDASLYFSGRWVGEIRRTRDGQLLSKACAEFGQDSLTIYSNAIFGKKNSSLFNAGYRNEAFRCIGGSHEFMLRPRYQDDRLILAGEDFELSLFPCDSLWDEYLSLYKGYDVSTRADDYLFGTYQGSSVGRIKNAGMLFAMFGMAPNAMDMRIRMTLTFLEGNRVQMTNEGSMVNRDMQMLTMLSGSTGETDTSILKYRVEGNQITIGKGDRLLMRPDGDLYYVGADEKGLMLDPFILRRMK